jgi:hypothetical protein
VKFEEVSTDSVLQIFTIIYSGYVVLVDTVANYLALTEPPKTLAFMIALHLITLWIWIGSPSDMAVACLVYNLHIGSPFFWPRIEPYMAKLSLKTPYLQQLCEKKLN